MESSTSKAVEVLNRALQKDRSAIKQLFAYRVRCNNALAADETIQIRERDGALTLGVLGLINGLFGVDSRDWGAIAVQIDEAGELLGFEELPYDAIS